MATAFVVALGKLRNFMNIPKVSIKIQEKNIKLSE